MVKIRITCDHCNGSFLTKRTKEIPPEVTQLFCNWCPLCEDEAEDYYDERYSYEPLPEIENPDQIKLF